MKIQSSSLTDVGRVRKNNQDYLGVFEPSGTQEDDHIYILCDGMGGYKGGEVASQLVTREIIGRFKTFPRENGDMEEALTTSINNAHKVLKETAQKQEDLSRMGTTLVMAVIRSDHLYLANVGDCRAYLFRNNKLIQITEDHSRVEELVREGVVSRKDARNINQNILTRSISAAGTTPPVDFFTRVLKRNDTLLLCSDGVWKQVPQKKIAKILQRSTPANAVKKLVDESNRAGGVDNSSVIVIYAKEEKSAKAGGRTPKAFFQSLAIVLLIIAILAALILTGIWFFWLR